MPTANREQFIPAAIQHFLKQDYPNKELIIVDDGTNSIEHLVPKNDVIKYFRLENSTKKTTGEKRNIACEKSLGEIIAHWDDDDFYAADWLSFSVKILQENEAAICGLSQLYFYSPTEKKCWQYFYPAHEKAWVAGATMVYKKSLWQQNNFKHKQIGEDNDFVWSCSEKIFVHDYINGFVATVHANNTSVKRMMSSRWKAIPTVDVVTFLQ
jgi:glycosyltransferase involved in cell wall biosynthesis